eukprot:GGOE01014119.1.p1 GENE.GGOE01014119.1~~GGOE01014119.1.p1  ORF type:complete len:514 (+),score=211.97 GGOE01014119.1:30-1544(+)
MEHWDEPPVDEFSPEDVAGSHQKARKAREKRRWRADLDQQLSEGPYASTSVGKNTAFDFMAVGGSGGKTNGRQTIDHADDDDENEDEDDASEADEDGEDKEDEEEGADYTKADAEALMDDIFAEAEEDEAEEADREGETYEEWMAEQERRLAARRQQRKGRKEAMSADEEVVSQLLHRGDHADRELGRLKAAAAAQKQKGQHAKNQLRIYADIVNLRIRLQKPLSGCSRLPTGPMLALFERYAEAEGRAPRLAQLPALLQEARSATNSLLRELFEFHDALVADSPAYFHTARAAERAERAKKRKRTDDEALEDAEALWRELGVYYEATKPFVDNTLELWGAKARAYEGNTAKKFKALDQSPLEQIRNALRDKEGLIQKTQINRLKLKPLGRLHPVAEADGEATDPHLYDDSDFYGQLLGEVLAGGLNGPENAADLVRQMEEKREMQRKQNIARMLVDRQGNKSRKVQFDPHERLVNFMAPKPCNAPPHTDSLFLSLFWSARGAA